MAVYNEIQTGQLSIILAKRLGMKEGTPAPSLQPEIHAALVLENDRPEWKVLAGERLVAGGGAAVASAGTRSKFRIFNPLGSNTLIVIERLWLTSASGQLSLRRTGSIPIATPLTTVLMDTRDRQVNTSGNNSAAQVGYANEVGGTPGSAIFYRSDTPVVERLVELSLILTPGFGFEADNQTDNVALSVHAQWRERALVPSELG